MQFSLFLDRFFSFGFHCGVWIFPLLVFGNNTSGSGFQIQYDFGFCYLVSGLCLI